MLLWNITLMYFANLHVFFITNVLFLRYVHPVFNWLEDHIIFLGFSNIHTLLLTNFVSFIFTEFSCFGLFNSDMDNKEVITQFFCWLGREWQQYAFYYSLMNIQRYMISKIIVANILCYSPQQNPFSTDP